MNIQDIITFAAPVLTAAAGWFTGRRKLKADAASSELANVQHAIKIWRETAEALEGKVEELSHNLDEMRSENRSLKLQIENLERTIQSYATNNTKTTS